MRLSKILYVQFWLDVRHKDTDVKDLSYFSVKSMKYFTSKKFKLDVLKIIGNILSLFIAHTAKKLLKKPLPTQNFWNSSWQGIESKGKIFFTTLYCSLCPVLYINWNLKYVIASIEQWSSKCKRAHADFCWWQHSDIAQAWIQTALFLFLQNAQLMHMCR